MLLKKEKQIQEEVLRQVGLERARIEEEAKKKAEEKTLLDMKDLKEQLNEKDKRLEEARKAELELRKQRRELEERQKSIELELSRRLDEEREKIRSEAVKAISEEHRLKDLEKDKKISDMLQQIEDLKRRAEQGPGQLKGEVLEIELEDLLRAEFPFDQIEPVAKGKRGADILQKVHNASGQYCGTIIWETKRTKGWNDGWIDKLKEDQREAKAEIAVIVTTALPKEVSNFALIDWVWVGFEGKRAGYEKMQGRPYSELIPDLHRHGISVLTSMIIGFDYQTAETIDEEFEELLALRPSMSQFLIYGPAHGTPAHARLAAQGRLLPEVMENNRLHDGFSLGFEHPHLSPEQLSAQQRRLFREEFARLGPSVYRVVEDMLEGYLNLRAHPAARVRAKAEKYRRAAHRASVLLPAGRAWVNASTRRWLDGLQERLRQHTGALGPAESALARLMPAALRYTDFKLRRGLDRQPAFSRRTYRMGTGLERFRSWVEASARPADRAALGT
jgi:hypothetical protein